MLYTLATIQARTHTIYKYKGREAAGVGGHALQEITTRGHPRPRRRSKKDYAAHARPSVCFACRVCHGSGGEGHDKTPQAMPAAPTPPDRPGCIWWQLMTPTTPEPSRLCLVATRKDNCPPPFFFVHRARTLKSCLKHPLFSLFYGVGKMG